MSYSKIRKVRISKFDKEWSKRAREDTPFCAFCGQQQNLAAHHIVRRSVKSTRLLLINAVVLCPSHHVFNHLFSAHRTPEAFKKWVTKQYPDRMKTLKKRERIMMNERQAIAEFQQTYAQAN